jgi:hypothetical protein
MTAGKFIIAAALVASTAPALAHRPGPVSGPPATTPTSVPEPGDAGLFLLGAVGVAAGRWMHARRARKQKADQSGE